MLFREGRRFLWRASTAVIQM